MTEWADQQPKDGDLIVHCGHVEGHWHFWQTKDPVTVMHITAAGAGILEAYWIAACEKCFLQSEGDATKIEIAGHGHWTGDAPVIKKPS